MAGRANLQRMSWAFGQLSHKLLGRSDLDAYRQGSHRQDNWITNKSGSIDKRNGSRLVLSLSDDSLLDRLIPIRGGALPLVLAVSRRVVDEQDSSVMEDAAMLYGHFSADQPFAARGSLEAGSDLTEALYSVLPNAPDGVQFELYVPTLSAIAMRSDGSALSTQERLGDIPGGDKVSHGLYFEQRFVLGGPEDHPQTILGSRTPSSEDGSPRYDDWTQQNEVEETDRDFQTVGTVAMGAMMMSVNKIDSEGDVIAFAGDVATKDRTTFRFTGSDQVYTVTKTVSKRGTVSEDAVSVEFTPGATVETAGDTRVEFIHTTYEVNADHSFEWTIDGGADSFNIQWLAVYDDTLILGTDLGVAIIQDLAPDGAPTRRWHSTQGVARIQPQVTSFGVVAVGSDRRSIFEVVRKRDLMLYEEDLFESDRIKEIAWLQQPQPQLWVVTESGKLFCQTIHDPNRILAWAPCSREGTVRSICAVRGTVGADTLYLLVEYGEDGERVTLESWQSGDAVHTDCWAETHPAMEVGMVIDPGETGEPEAHGWPIEATLQLPRVDESIDSRFPGSGIGQDRRMAHLIISADCERRTTIKAGPPGRLTNMTFEEGESIVRETMQPYVTSGPPVEIVHVQASAMTITTVVAEMA